MFTYPRALSCIVALIVALSGYAQQGEMQMYSVHMDKVHPYKVADYEKVTKALHDQLVKHNIQDITYLSLAMDDFSYLYIAPIENFADLDSDPFAQLNEKAGEEEMGKIWEGFGPCYSEHGDFIISLDAELSYQPSGINPNPEGQYYRTLEYWYVDPENVSEIVDLAKQVKALHEKSGSEFYYRVYRSGFGTMGPYFMVASAAKSPQDWQTKADNSAKKCGEDLRTLLDKAFALTRQYERTHGWIRPDLSYAPK